MFPEFKTVFCEHKIKSDSSDNCISALICLFECKLTLIKSPFSTADLIVIWGCNKQPEKIIRKINETKTVLFILNYSINNYLNIYKNKTLMQLIIATGNKHKVQEIKKLLGKKIRLKQINIELHEPKSNSVEKIAESKAKQAFKKIKKPLIAEDTGIYFTALKNFPGTEPKRQYLKLGLAGLLKKLEGKKRNAFYKTVICFFDGKKTKFFEGKLYGKITEKVFLENKKVMAYEKIFVPKGKKKVLAFFSRKSKNKFSHRAKAAEKLKTFLEKN